MAEGKKKISYIKKALAVSSRPCLFCAAVSLSAFAASLGISAAGRGEAGMEVAALCVTSLLFGIFALGYAFLAFREKEKNYILAKIGAGISGAVLFFWAVLFFIAGRA